MKNKKAIIIATALSLAIALLYPLIVDCLYRIGEEYPLVVTAFCPSDVLNYGGTIIGSVIAGALTLVGVLITILAQREDQKNENKRLVMPMLKITPDEYDYKYSYVPFDVNLTEESKVRERKDIEDTKNVTIKVTNVGQRELLELYAGDFRGTFFDEGGHFYKLHPVLYSGDSISLNLAFYEKGVYDNDLDQSCFDPTGSPIDFRFYFKDCLENWYSQDFSLWLFHSITKGIPAEESALNISIERMDIRSAPKPLIGDVLPWEDEDSKIVLCS